VHGGYGYPLALLFTNTIIAFIVVISLHLINGRINIISCGLMPKGMARPMLIKAGGEIINTLTNTGIKATYQANSGERPRKLSPTPLKIPGHTMPLNLTNL
jgi:hypothetical protein